MNNSIGDKFSLLIVLVWQNMQISWNGSSSKSFN